ncbi:MAG: 16S rRNA (cytosine(1402)-N(4))-methyltransferase RsmH [Saprospiraceae bacterium]|nr:16S rRNA (cytosine(1402)-N(4))-methyltransferase RsmH [Saprospiraceae bacterium]
MSYHLPVLAAESIEAMAIKRDGVYVDATFGGGGHSRLILEQLGPNGRLIAFDQDSDAEANVPADDRIQFHQQNFRLMQPFFRLHGISQIDGLLADLGVSSHQFDTAERGFSFRFEAPLDMRMNQGMEVTAATVLRESPVEYLQEMFSRYGEVRNARTLAIRIAQQRNNKPLQTVGEFLELLEPLIRGNRARYLAQVFQALRIEVNDEIGALEELLELAQKMLKPGGRLVVMSYHSLEDRLVKHFLKTGNIRGEMIQDDFGKIYRPFRILTKKAIVPSEMEVMENPRSRSAKLRVGERIEEDDAKG